MGNINKVLLSGRLVKDAEIKYTPSNMAIVTFSVVNNQKKKEGDSWVDEPSFFDATMFGKYAEAMKPSLLKGKQVFIEGELKQERWTKDGQTRSKIGIVVRNIEVPFTGDKASGGTGGSYQSKAPAQPSAFDYSGEQFPEDIPF